MSSDNRELVKVRMNQKIMQVAESAMRTRWMFCSRVTSSSMLANSTDTKMLITNVATRSTTLPEDIRSWARPKRTTSSVVAISVGFRQCQRVLSWKKSVFSLIHGTDRRFNMGKGSKNLCALDFLVGNSNTHRVFQSLETLDVLENRIFFREPL